MAQLLWTWGALLACLSVVWSVKGFDEGCYVSRVEHVGNCTSEELCIRVFDKNSSDECEALATEDPSKNFYPVFARDEQSCRAYVQFKKGCDLEAPLKYSNGDDILLSKSEHMSQVLGGRNSRAATARFARRWAKSDDNRYYVPYDLDEAHWTNDQKQILFWSFKWIESNSYIRFIQRTNEQAYLLLVNGRHCSSYLGRMRSMQRVTLHPWCRHRGIMIHEFFHALGVPHEHTRPDRDDHLELFTDNFSQGAAVNFRVYPGFTSHGPYDFASIMQYSSTSFAKASGLITMLPKNNTISTNIMNSRASSPTACDFQSLNDLYPGYNYTEPCVPNTFLHVCEPTDDCTFGQEECEVTCTTHCDYNLKNSFCQIKSEYSLEALTRIVEEMDQTTSTPSPAA